MKNIYFFILSLVVAGFSTAQSFHTVNLTGNFSDFNLEETYNSSENADIKYGVAYDEDYLYFGVYNTAMNFGGSSDAFTIFIDTDPDGSNGTATGNNFNGVTPTLPFNADVAIRVEEFYNERRNYDDANSTWDNNYFPNFTAQVGGNHRSFRILKSDIGDPAMIRFTMWMGYSGGHFAEVPADVASPSGTPVFTEYFGSTAVNRAGANPSKVVNINATYATYGTGSTVPSGTYSKLDINGFPTSSGDITIAAGGTLAISGITIANWGSSNIIFENWAGMTVDVGAPATINTTGEMQFSSGGISRTNSTFQVAVTITPDITVSGDFYAYAPLIRNSIKFTANGFNRLPLRFFQDSELIYNSDAITTTGAEWGTGSILTLPGVPDNIVIDQPNLQLDTDKNLFGYLKLDSGTIDLNGNNLRLVSNSSGTAVIAPIESGASIAGNTIVAEKYIPKRSDDNPAFRFLASPVNGQSIYESIQENGSNPLLRGTQVTGGLSSDGFDQSLTNNPSMFKYVNNPLPADPDQSPRWEAVTSTNTELFNVGIPYRTYIRGNRSFDLTNTGEPASTTTLKATGSIVSGQVAYDNTSTINRMNDAPGAFNMIANPYAAFTNVSSVLQNSAGVNPNVYYAWDPTINTRGAYVSIILDPTNPANNGVNNNVDSDADQFVEPWQSFFTVNDAIVATQQIVFNESDKTLETTAPQVFSTPSTMDRVQLTLRNVANNSLDGLLLDFDTTYNSGIDALDAPKLSNIDENLSGEISGIDFSVVRSDIPSQSFIIPLRLDNYRVSNYKIEALVDGLIAHDVILIDHYMNTQHNLKTSHYPFSVDENIAASVASDRFELSFNYVTLGVDDTAFAKAISIYPNPVINREWYINNSTATPYNVTIYNMLGQIVQTVQKIDSREAKMAQLKSGTYLVKIFSDNQSVTKKLIVK